MTGLYILFFAMLMATANTQNLKLPSDCYPNSKCPLNDDGYAIHLPDSNNCHKFFKCTRGMACLKECPHYGNGNQLVFNPKEQVCDWPFNVPNLPNCIYPGQSISTSSIKTETTTSPPTTPSTTTPSTTTPPTTTSPTTTSPTTTSPTTTSPTTTESTTTSPTTTESTTTKSTTTSPTTTESTTTKSTTTSSTTPEIPSTPCTTKNIEDKEDCRYYYVYDCKTETKQRQKCQEGLVFNPIIESCDRPKNYPCSTTSSPLRK
ncbi:integumentary mucin C.1-like [Apis dorsata]|uniref:integumentary mucin C.1-like n=1 Tax=Apis dorsata TaxID=7462 RepID=UPI001293545B|nr:integumentary mucin C.1-like [Apis dorsata]